jgi:hypothetical protein
MENAENVLFCHLEKPSDRLLGEKTVFELNARVHIMF